MCIMTLSPFELQTIKRPSLKLETKLAEAELRRKELEEEKVKTVLERSGVDRHGRMRSASAYKREQQYSATVAKRQQQLQEMRDNMMLDIYLASHVNTLFMMIRSRSLVQYFR